MFKRNKVLVFVLIFFFMAAPLAAVRAEDYSDYNFYIFRRGNGAGNVTVKSAEQITMDCGDTCVSNLVAGDKYVLSAKANEGSTFKGWSINSDNTSRDPQIITDNFDFTFSGKSIIYAKFVLNQEVVLPPTASEDLNIPRVMFWPGKVNQHWDLDKKIWTTDQDGFSGSRENKLEYCQRFYPDTEKVVAYKEETTNTWKDAGNVNNYTSKKLSYRCVLKGESIVGEDASNVVEKPNKGSVCYWFPNNPLCLPLNNPKAVRSALGDKIDSFVANGVDKNSIKLGEGERMAVVKSYEQAFKKLPETEEEFSDVVKISNGQWPSKTNPEAEKAASVEFQKIYKRVPNLSNVHDAAAITVMAYGLRQKAENRNLLSEAAALKTFKNIYKRIPSSTNDWNILQSITYSGATRETDSDGDLLSDRREKELGTDPLNKDTDGDGYFDGLEVANGYDPLVADKE